MFIIRSKNVYLPAVSNFLSSAAVETTISVTKASDPLPEVTVEGPLQGKAMAANSFYITAIAQVRLSDKSYNTDKVDFYLYSTHVNR